MICLVYGAYFVIKIWNFGLNQHRSYVSFELKSGQEVCWMLTPRDQLLASHEEFQKLAQEHTQYAQRLDSLTQKRYLTEDEKLEEVRLKKLKLRLKDQMESIERQYRQHQVA
jgi:uncharacterized protein